MMPAMSQDGARPTVLRSGGSMVLGIVGAVLLLLLAVVTGLSQPRLSALAVLGAVACHLLLIHPHVRIDERGVTVVNPLHRVLLPWARLDEVRSRWNLEVWSDDGRRVTAWGLNASVERPRASPMLPTSRSRDTDPAGSRGRGGMTAQRAQQVIEQAHGEWREMIAGGDLSPAKHSEVSRTWVWPNVALVVVGLLVAAAAMVSG